MNITTDILWRIHRAALRGRSSVTGDDLPEDISGCPLGAQAAHWAMALGAARLSGSPHPDAPGGLSDAEQHRIRVAVDRVVRPRSTVPEPDQTVVLYSAENADDGMYLAGELLLADPDDAVDPEVYDLAASQGGLVRVVPEDGPGAGIIWRLACPSDGGGAVAGPGGYLVRTWSDG